MDREEDCERMMQALGSNFVKFAINLQILFKVINRRQSELLRQTIFSRFDHAVT